MVILGEMIQLDGPMFLKWFTVNGRSEHQRGWLWNFVSLKLFGVDFWTSIATKQSLYSLHSKANCPVSSCILHCLHKSFESALLGKRSVCNFWVWAIESATRTPNDAYVAGETAQTLAYVIYSLTHTIIWSIICIYLYSDVLCWQFTFFEWQQDMFWLWESGSPEPKFPRKPGPIWWKIWVSLLWLARAWSSA